MESSLISPLTQNSHLSVAQHISVSHTVVPTTPTTVVQFECLHDGATVHLIETKVHIKMWPLAWATALLGLIPFLAWTIAVTGAPNLP